MRQLAGFSQFQNCTPIELEILIYFLEKDNNWPNKAYI